MPSSVCFPWRCLSCQKLIYIYIYIFLSLSLCLLTSSRTLRYFVAFTLSFSPSQKAHRKLFSLGNDLRPRMRCVEFPDRKRELVRGDGSNNVDTISHILDLVKFCSSLLHFHVGGVLHRSSRLASCERSERGSASGRFLINRVVFVWTSALACVQFLGYLHSTPPPSPKSPSDGHC